MVASEQYRLNSKEISKLTLYAIFRLTYLPLVSKEDWLV